MSEAGPEHHDARLQRLLEALPGPMQRGYEWVMRRDRWWARWPIGVALIAGGFLGFLPILGFWMVPLGALVLGHDIPPLRRATLWGLGWVQARWDSWRRRR